MQKCHIYFFFEVGEECWTGNFSQPELKTEADFLIDIQLELLSDFEFEFSECGSYELSIQPRVGGRLVDTRVKLPFTYLTVPQPVSILL